MFDANAPHSATPKIEDYIPTTEDVIRSYLIPTHLADPRGEDESFLDYIQRIGGVEAHNNRMLSERAAWRWLNRIKAEAWDEGALARGEAEDYFPENPYRTED